MKPQFRLILRVGFALALLLTLAPETRAAIITYAGAQFDLGSGWRTSAIGKTRDIDADNVFGSDGYYVVNRPAVLPSYVSSATILTSTHPGNTNYACLDDPTNLPSLFTSDTMNQNPGAGVSTSIFRFTLNVKAASRTIRVGLLVEI